jgi:F-type H+-transporting ATPase subunit epsilon
MEKKKILFELVSPEKRLMVKPVEMVVIPGTEGVFGVMAGHMNFVASLKPGVVEVHEEGPVSEQFFISGGFAEVGPERCIVLAEEAVRVEDLNAEEIAKQISILKEDILDERASAKERAIHNGHLMIDEAKLALAS